MPVGTTPALKVLVVEDDPLARELLGAELNEYEVDFAADENEARRKLASTSPDICFIDLKLGDGDENCSGLRLIPKANARGSYAVVMSSHDTDPYVDKAYSLGARDFFAKGNVKENVATVLARFQASRQEHEVAHVFEDVFVTSDENTKAAIEEALKYAASELPMLILGPSGSGKTTLARIVHDRSGRTGQFVAINCSSYTDDLLEVELFGYRKGAFTDARDNRKGKLLLADGGTLFLDEIGSMSVKMQAKLLKALEEKQFYPLGSERPETSKFRIISATLEDPASLITAGKLRPDFFQRVIGVTVRIPPLSQRPADVFKLVDRFTRGGRRLAFSPEAKEALRTHSWPGNVRELKKLVDLLVAGDEGRVPVERVREIMDKLSIEEGGEPITTEQYHYALEHGLKSLLDRVSKAVIERYLAENGGKKRRALADLKTDTRTFYKALRNGPGGKGADR